MSILHSIKWNYLGALFKGVLQLAVLAIMARLLVPEEFGLMALALTTVKVGGYFSDFGLAAAIQQKSEITRSDIEASFWFSFVSGLFFFIATFLLAEPLAEFFQAPKLVPVIELLAVNFVLIGASATSTGLLKRNMQFKYLSMAETVTYLIGNGFIGVALAYYEFGVFSLSAAYLTQTFLLLVAAYAKTRHSLRITFRLSDYKHIIKYGGGYSIASFMTFVGSNIDHILVGKFFPSAELGLWNRSRNLISMPSYNLLVSITRVLLPAYSKCQHDKVQFRELYLKSLAVTGFFLIPVGGGMYAAAAQLVEVMLGSNWQSAVTFVQLSAIFVPVEMLASVAATACSALGALSLQIRLQAYLLILLIPGMLFFALNGQIMSILLVLAAYYWLRFIIYICILNVKLDIRFGLSFKILASQLVAGAWISALIYLLSRQLDGLNAFQLLPLQILIGAIGFFIFTVIGPAKYFRVILRSFVEARSASSRLAKISRLLKNGY
ncbi:lipopolysaccharide biosynthesis protein [Methylomonas sp. SURF-1]|uniref:Lipopolysaccharide biosynthesis protein n=1 Tax=Methylomonas aurea TaxID=2952224 RepID=A0ABT1ULR2_9GAMM|nr:lipopolysaccharide biosynthesis protein [Methylomonas sp. SURF-1]MCQ8183173.1 lipopolysaccharide biosynthesis protein [Methylomonas sp. SURF-1]